ncbi:MAG TPA: hypothetical protein PKM70_09120 [Clostridia bacterium]|nr:hypothetical protein [Clostridia bacterium]
MKEEDIKTLRDALIYCMSKYIDSTLKSEQPEVRADRDSHLAMLTYSSAYQLMTMVLLNVACNSPLQVTFCKDCEYWQKMYDGIDSEGVGFCKRTKIYEFDISGHDYCSFAEKRKEEENNAFN